MSRIQTILDKAEREGTARRFRNDFSAGEPAAVLPAPPPPAGLAPAPPFAARRSRPAAAPDDGGGIDRDPAQDPVDAVDPDMVASDLPSSPTADEPPAFAAAARPAPAPAPPSVAAAGTAASGRSAARIPLAPSLVAALDPNALAAEQFRTLRTRIANSANGRGARTLMLTSPGRGEGKSVMAANLALTMGQEIQQRVCLVDASLRDGSQHALFGLPESPGLADVLNGDASLDDALFAFDEYQLTVLPAGRLPRQPAELLAGREMRRVLDVLRSRFDRVIIDAPAAMPMADVSILVPLVDGVLVVVRAGVTETPTLQNALGTLDRSRVLGVVLNDIHG